MYRNYKIPFYLKATFLVIGALGTIYMLYITRTIILPLIFALIIAVVLHPAVALMLRFRINRIAAIIIILLLAILAITAIGSFLISQIIRLSDTWPDIVEKFNSYLNEIITWASGYFDIKPQKILSWIAKTKSEFINTSGSVIGNTLINVGNGVFVILLIPVYVFMILFYQPLLMEFFRRIFGANHRTEVSSIMTQIKKVIQSYLTGLVIEAAIVATMNTIALLILGIDYAVLLGIMGALLNVVPYLGGLIAVALPMMVAFLTKDSGWYPLYVMAAYYFIQLIDNNYIVPKIVASKVKINALVSIVVVLAFGTLWGIPGMFISIPLTAIIKLIFDHIESLKPWGYLLGDTFPRLNIIKVKTDK
ncbi:MAG: AI-2E family transporter [Bacteroidetes bacterium]|nr:AI-2E family transporter [Bacteroidota bacterium]